jgi:hypothetical protein
VLAFQFAGNAGEQKLHNTALWQRFHPVTPGLATTDRRRRSKSIDTRRVAQAVVQTEKGLYFLTGAKFVPPAGSQVVVQTNERWDLFLCAADGSRCMSIHSFCADAVWPKLQRDEKGRIDGCYAPRALDTPHRSRPSDQAADGGARRRGQAQAPAARAGHVASARMGLAHGLAGPRARLAPLHSGGIGAMLRGWR